MRKIVKNLKIYRLVAWILAITMLAGYVPQGVHFPCFDVFKSMEKVEAETTLQNPKIVEDFYMDSGQTVTWDCVWFGSYPQSEVTAENGTVYDKLKKATNWDDNNDVVIEGTKYRRLKGEDATRATFDEEGFYDWNGSYTTYHYFKYEPIKWRVLNTDGKEAFLLADVALDDQKYNTDFTNVTWETCSMRRWLNKQFINTAFSLGEKNAIPVKKNYK